MKLLILTFWLLLTLIELALSREVRVSWDLHPQQILGYRLYVNGSLVAATTNTTWLLTTGDAQASVSLTAYNAAGESMHAGPLVIPAVIPLPTTIIQRSSDLVTWTFFMTLPAYNKPQLRVLRTAPDTITLEQSHTAATGWQFVATTPYNPPEFFRLQLPPE